MATEQKCNWKCDLCGKEDQSWGKEKAPTNWCKASLMLRFNGGRHGSGVLDKDGPSPFWTIDVCDNCYHKTMELRDNNKTYWDHKETVHVNFIKKLWNYYFINGEKNV